MYSASLRVHIFDDIECGQRHVNHALASSAEAGLDVARVGETFGARRQKYVYWLLSRNCILRFRLGYSLALIDISSAACAHHTADSRRKNGAHQLPDSYQGLTQDHCVVSAVIWVLLNDWHLLSNLTK
jgi:hypothetical protein